MRMVIAILCVLSLVLVACGDDDSASSVATVCEKNAALNEVNADLFGPPMDKTPEEVETLAVEAVAIVEEMEAAAPEEIREVMDQLVPFETIAEVLEQNSWDVEASGDDLDALLVAVDPATIDEYEAFLEENCTTGSEPEG